MSKFSKYVSGGGSKLGSVGAGLITGGLPGALEGYLKSRQEEQQQSDLSRGISRENELARRAEILSREANVASGLEGGGFEALHASRAREPYELEAANLQRTKTRAKRGGRLRVLSDVLGAGKQVAGFAAGMGGGGQGMPEGWQPGMSA